MVEQVGGTHYSRLQYETWDFILDNNIDFFIGNAIKYISRYKYKNGIEDLKKAKSYIQKVIDEKIYCSVLDIHTNSVKAYICQFDKITQRLLILVLSGDYEGFISILGC